jgi:ribonuclease HII
MKYPSLSEEKKLWKKGYKYVAGLDEVGRGPLAGPVVAAAVVLQISNDKFLIQKQFQSFKFKELFKNLKLKIKNLQLRDSKKLTPKKREELYQLLIRCPLVEWGIGRVSEKVIDRINILEATKLAMEKAINNLKYKVDFLILDGNFKLDLPIPQKAIIKGDEKVFSCAAASILAKVTRDRLMVKYDKKYPQYGFLKHKGYPTKHHIKMLKKYGLCQIHRKSFRPVKILKLKAQNSKPQLKT